MRGRYIRTPWQSTTENRRPLGGLDRGLAGRSDQPDPRPDVVGFRCDPLLGLGQHRSRWVQDRDVVPQPSEGERLVPRTSANVQHRGRRGRQVPQELLVQDVGPHLPLHGGVGAIDERISQRLPCIFDHLTMLSTPGSVCTNG